MKEPTIAKRILSAKKEPNADAGAQTPEFTQPCLPQTITTPPTGDTWVHEIKYDGYRVQAHLAGGHVRLMTRNGLDWTTRFGHLAEDVAQLRANTVVIDGEAIVANEAGLSDFAALSREMGRTGSRDIVLMAFDLLYIDGRDMRPLPLAERKAVLAALLGDRKKTSLIHYSSHMDGDGPAILRNACAMQVEGIVSKRTDLPYRSGRLGDWTKSKCFLADPFVVLGYVASNAASRSVGSLVLGYYDGTELNYAGRVGSGFSQDEAHALWEGLSQISGPAPALSGNLTKDQRSGVFWVEPRLVAQVRYAGWTDDGNLRHATLKHLRDDKVAREISRPASLVRPAARS